MSLEHADVEDRGLIARYLAGRLDPEETEAFEEHYLHCGRCLDQLEADAEIGRALRIAAAQDAVTVARPVALAAWLARLARSRQAAAVVGVVLVALALPFTWQQHRLTELMRERDAARAAAEAAGERAAARRMDGQVGLSERAARDEAERQRLELELERERRARAEAEKSLERAFEPQGHTSIVRLSPLRSLGGEPADRLHLGADAGWVVLALELPSTDYPSYRVRIKRAGASAEPVWSQAGLLPDAEGSLALSVHASRLTPGDYEALVDGVARDGRTLPAGRFSLRVVVDARSR